MSRSLALVNGDLAVGPGRAFQVLSGREKLLQDLKLWILERIGTDPATPAYGSRLDGGNDNGERVDSVIGQIVTDEVLMGIRGEIIRLVENYQSMQYEKLRAETIAYLGQTTLDNDEVVSGIASIHTKAIGTVVIVQVALDLVSGDVVKLTLPVDTNTEI